MENDGKRLGIYLNEKLLNTVDTVMSKTDASSRSEFISEALKFYIAWLESKNITEVLTPALESVIGSKILDTEDRIARVLFKQGVELAMLMHIIAATNDIDVTSLDKLRATCVKEVKKNSGKYSFEDAVRFQQR